MAWGISMVTMAVPSTSPMPRQAQLSDGLSPLGAGIDLPFQAEPVHIHCGRINPSVD